MNFAYDFVYLNIYLLFSSKQILLNCQIGMYQYAALL